VVLPRRQLFYNAVATTVGWELGAGDVVPVCTPLFHTGGWNVFLTPILHVGGTAVLFDQFDAARYLAGLRAHGCTVAFGVPTQLQMMQACAAWGEPLPRLRWIISGGAPCPPTVRAAVRAAGYGFREGYGLTECGPNCFVVSDAVADAHPGVVGWPAPFLEARLAGEDGGPVPDGEPGELQLRGPQLFAGAPERTAEVLTADGWLRTGDLARRDARGLHAICGRSKDMYISGGENVFPGEVEAALLDCPGVAEAAVIGVPDARWGEVGRAYVVARAVGAPGTDVLLAHARRLLAGYKVPKQVVFVDALPRLGSGKIDRRALATLGGPAAASAASAWPAEVA
jgi:fatty-acyl-CoA synthase